LSGEKTITIVGWGNQARAWAANLRDSGWSVHVALRAGSASALAAADAAVVIAEGAALPKGPVAMLVPDDQIASALTALIPRVAPDTLVLYAHGYAPDTACLAERHPQLRHALLAPKAIGTEVRATYLDRRPLGGVFALDLLAPDQREGTRAELLALSRDLGITMGPYECTVRQEMVADLFSEQSVLCSVIPEACRLSFEMLRARGVPAELAYFELWHEVGLIVRTMVERGPEAFFKLISPNALIGAEKGREVLCGEEFQRGLKKLLQDIEDGSFTREIDRADARATRERVVSEWRDSEFGQTITRMQT
jgi:ketol-acid reductoisomerase